MKQTITSILLLALCLSANAKIDRQAVITRNNPKVNSVDSLSSLTVGNGGFAFTADATGLQTFPEHYKNGVPLGTMSDWGWHSFPNTENYRAEEAFDQKMYSIEKFQDERRKAAANYLRANPHRLHLGTIGFDIPSPQSVTDTKQELQLWTGLLKSSFAWRNKQYQVETACDPIRDLIAARIKEPERLSPSCSASPILLAAIRMMPATGTPTISIPRRLSRLKDSRYCSNAHSMRPPIM